MSVEERRTNKERRSISGWPVELSQIIGIIDAHERRDEDRERRNEQRYKDLNKKMDEVIEFIRGDASTYNPGIDKRVDRLEQRQGDRSKVRDWLLGGAFGAIGIYIANKFLGG